MPNYFRQGETLFPFLLEFFPPIRISQNLWCTCILPTRTLLCKTLVDMTFSKTPTAKWDYEYFLCYFCLLSLLSSNTVCLILGIMPKIDYQFVKKTQAEKEVVEKAKADKGKMNVMVEEQWVPLVSLLKTCSIGQQC